MAIHYSPNQTFLNKTIYLYKKEEIKTHERRALISAIVAVLLIGIGATLCALKIGNINGMIASGVCSGILAIIAIGCAFRQNRIKKIITPKDLLDYLLESPEVQRETDPKQRNENRKQLISHMHPESYKVFVSFIADKKNISLGVSVSSIADKKNISIDFSKVGNFLALLTEIKEYNNATLDNSSMKWSKVSDTHPEFYQAINKPDITDSFKEGGYYAECVVRL